MTSITLKKQCQIIIIYQRKDGGDKGKRKLEKKEKAEAFESKTSGASKEQRKAQRICSTRQQFVGIS